MSLAALSSIVQTSGSAELFAASLGVLFAVVYLVLVGVLGVSAYRNRRAAREIRRYRDLIVGQQSENLARWIQILRPRQLLEFLEAYIRVCDQTVLSESDQEQIEHALKAAGAERVLIARLNSGRRFHRAQAATFLAYFASTRAAAAIDNALRRERSHGVRIRLVYAIVRRRYLQSVPTVFDSLHRASKQYRQRVAALLGDLGSDVLQFLPMMRDRSEPELQLVWISLAAEMVDDDLQQYLEQRLSHPNPKIAREAFRVLVTNYADSVDLSTYAQTGDPYYSNLAIEALAKRPSRRTVDEVLPLLAQEDTRESAVAALSRMIGAVPALFSYVVTLFRNTRDPSVRGGLSRVIASRSEYFVITALRQRWHNAELLIGEVLRTRQAAGVLGMLNRNTDQQFEQRVCELIGRTVRTDDWLRNEFGLYAKDSVLQALQIEQRTLSTERGERKGEAVRGTVLLACMALAVLGPLLGYLTWWLVSGNTISFALLPGYLTWFGWGFAAYAFALNSVYLILLIAAVRVVGPGRALRRTIPYELAFRPGVLPSVSVIAPAYNEEATIVESVTALLNLNYPVYEVIVVNDGSLDQTLNSLLEGFELERTGLVFDSSLATRTIRGVYRNPRIPGLTVIDKSNGGKADALNTGINAAAGEYFAAIDADSLLEPNALLYLALGMLDSDVPVVATGGNVLPINGCRVERGHIDRVELPRRPLVRFQMVEYLRAFMAGRTGWAGLDCLLIVSGAFGLFNKSEVEEAHGYLTASERFSKDTVGEDMELVIRLRRHLRDKGKQATVQYASEANCWTEVPDSLQILSAQRDRWQRGLIDILMYHVKMLCRPRYGRVGFLALPYYYIFEFFGPWIEAKGYLVVVVGLVLGLVPVSVFVAAFVSAIVLGTLVSLASILLVESGKPLFERRARFQIIVATMLESFGYRQFVNWLRVRGYLSALRHQTGWGTMRRRGFLKPVSSSRESK